MKKHAPPGVNYASLGGYPYSVTSLLVVPLLGQAGGPGDTGLGAEEEFQHEMFCSLTENIGGNSLSAWVWAAQADTQNLL